MDDSAEHVETKRFRLTSIMVALVVLVLMGGIALALLTGISGLFRSATLDPTGSAVAPSQVASYLAPGATITAVRAETLGYDGGRASLLPEPTDTTLIILAMESGNPQLTALRTSAPTILPMPMTGPEVRPWFSTQLANDLRAGKNITVHEPVGLTQPPFDHGMVIFHNPSGQVVIVLQNY